MTTVPDPSFLSVSHESSANKKRDVLWNVIEPGDPYDIRKSVIARMPGCQVQSMAGKTELICLFQSAQIQRLNQYLQQYKVRYLQLERKQMDRHSYEIQVKELTEKIKDTEGIQIQNDKLREFCKKLSAENEQIKNSKRSDTSLQKNYESALRKIQSLLNDINHLEQQLNAKNQNYCSEIQAVKIAKNKEIQGLERQYQSTHKVSAMNEITSLKMKYQGQIRANQKQIQKLNETLRLKNIEIDDLTSKNQIVSQELRNVSERANQIFEMQRKITFLSQEIEKISTINKDLNRVNSTYEMEKKNYEKEKNRMKEQLRKCDVQNRENKEIIGEMKKRQLQLKKDTNQSIQCYEQKIFEAISQIDRLTNLLKAYGNESQRLKSEHEQLLFQLSKLSIVQKENIDLKTQIDQDKRSIASYQKKQNILLSDVERLKNLGNQLNQRKKQNAILKSQNQNLKKVSTEQQLNYQKTISLLKIQHQKQISNMINKTDQQTEDKVCRAINEIDRLSHLLGKYQRQNEFLGRKKVQLQNFLEQEEKSNREIVNQQARNIQNLDNLNHQLERKIYDLKEQNIRYSDYESQVKILKKDYQKLIEDQKNKQKKIRESIENIFKLENNMKLKDNELIENNIKLRYLSSQYEETKRNHENANKKIEIIQKQNENLHKKLRSTQQAANFSQKRLLENMQMLQKENKALKNEYRKQEQMNKQKNQYISEQYTRKITNLEDNLHSFQDKYINIVKESRNLEEMINQGDEKIVKMNRIINQQQKKSIKLSQQLIEANQTIEFLRKQNKQNKFEILQNQAEIQNLSEEVSLLSPEIRRLNEILRLKRDQNNESSTKVKSLTSENQFIRQKIIQTETDIGLYMKERKELYRSIEENEIRVKQYESKFPQIDSELDRLQKIIYRREQNIRSLEQTIKVRDEQIKKLKRQIYETNDRRIQNERNISSLQMDITRLEELNKHSTNQILLQRERCQELEQYIGEIQSNNQISKQSLTCQNLRLREELKELYDNLTQEDKNKKEINQKIKACQKENENLKKKMKKNVLNLSSQIRKIQFLEEQISRLKNDKRSQQIVGMVQLKKEIEEVKTKNLDYQLYFEEINSQLANKKKQAQEEKQKNSSYAFKIEQLQKKIQGKEFVPKKTMEITRKYLDNQLKKQLDFYEGQLKRIMTDNENKLKKRQEDVEVMKKLIEEEKIKSNQSKFLIESLQQKVKRLADEISGLLSRADEIQFQKRKVLIYYQDLERENLQTRKISDEFQHQLEKAMKQNSQLTKVQTAFEEHKYKIKEYDDKIKILNPQLTDLLHKNEELKIQILDKDEQISFLKKEKLKMTNSIRDLENALENLMNDYTSSEQKIQILIQSNKQLKYTCSEIFETKEKISQLERERELLNYELKSMTDLLNHAKTENQELLKSHYQKQGVNIKQRQDIEKQLNNFEIIIQQLKSENQSYKKKIENLHYIQQKKEQLENEVFELEKQMDKLYKIIHQKTNEINLLESETNLLKSDIDSLTFKNTTMERELSLTFSNTEEKIKSYEFNISQLNEQISLLTKKNSELSCSNLTEITKRENSISSMREQIEMLNNLVKDKQRAITELNEKVNALSEQNRSVAEQLQDFHSHLSQKTMSFRQNIGTLQGENQVMKKKTSDYEKLRIKITDQNENIKFLNSEIQKLHRIVELKDNEINRYQIENEETYKKYQRASAERDDESQKVLLEQNEYKRLLIEHQNVQKKIASYDSGLKKMMEEFQRLQEIIERLKKDKDSAFLKNQGLIIEIKRLKEQNTIMSQRLEDLSLNLAQEIDLEKRAKEHMALLVVLFAQIESLRSRVADKEKQIEEVRRDSLTPLTL